MKRNPFTKQNAVMSLAAALALAGVTLAQPGPIPGRDEPDPMPQQMMNCQPMMQQIKANDSKLLSQLDSLEGASTEAKIDLLVDMVSILVEDRVAMHEGLWEMPPMSPEEVSQAERIQSTAQENRTPGSPRATN